MTTKKFVVTYNEAEIEKASKKTGMSPAQIKVIVDALNESVDNWLDKEGEES